MKENFSDADLAAMRGEVLAWIERDHRRRAAPIVAAAEMPPDRRKRLTAKPRLPLSKNKVVATRPTRPRAVMKVAPQRPLEISRFPLALPAGRTAGMPTEKRPGRQKGAPRPRRRPSGWWVGGTLISLLTTTVLVFLIGVYVQGWHGPVTMAIARWAPLPAATAGKNILWLDDYLADVETLRRQADRLGRPVTETSFRQQTVTRFATQAAIEGLAQRYQVTVSVDEVSNRLRQLEQQLGSAERLRSAVREDFPGWGTEQFARKLLRPYLMAKALRAKLWQDERAWEEAARRLTAIHQAVTAGTMDFADAATRANRDGSAAASGDLGYRSQAELDPAVYMQAAGLADGHVAPPLRTARGYLLIRREGSAGEGTELRLRLREIVVTPDVFFETQFNDELRRLTFRRLVP